MITQCCVCKKVHTAEGWINPSPALLAGMSGPISHGYCPECLAKALADIESFVKPAPPKPESMGVSVPFIAAIPSAAR